MKKIKNLCFLLVAIIAISVSTPNTHSAPTQQNQYTGYRGNSGNKDKDKESKRYKKPDGSSKDKTTLGNRGGNSDKRYDGNRGKRKDFDKDKSRRPIRGDKWKDNNRRPGKHHNWDDDDWDDDRHKPGKHHGWDDDDWDDDRHKPGKHHGWDDDDWDDDRHHGHHGHYRPVAPPRRPYRPRPHIVYRPSRPHNYCPYDHAPVLRTILGLEFGFRVYASIDRLRNTGYFIDGYSEKEVYLRNVKELGYKWEDVILYYSRGGLTNVSFYYSSHKHSTKRFDKLYKRLCREYGRPVMYANRHNMMEASWFDGSGRNFVTLSFKYERSFGGSSRYYTTLTYGN